MVLTAAMCLASPQQTALLFDRRLSSPVCHFHPFSGIVSMLQRPLLYSVLALLLSIQPVAAQSPAAVNSERMHALSQDQGNNWMSWGRGYDEQRFSPLEQIHADNVDQLELAWYYDLETFRGVEGTPLVID